MCKLRPQKIVLLFVIQVGLYGLHPIYAQDQLLLSNGGNGDWVDLFSDSNGLNDGVQAIAADRDGHLFVGGNFTEAGGMPAQHIAQWDGKTWKPLGSGVNQPVRDIAVYGKDLYIAGDFTMSDNLELRYIAKWNGEFWEALGYSVNASVSCIEISENGELYIGGSFIFTNNRNEKVAYVARWSGTDWEPVGGEVEGHSGLDGSSGVYAMTFGTSGDLYVGGYFAKAGGIVVNNIARLNGTTWEALESGTNQAVRALAISRTGEVYAGGSFLEAGGIAVNHIARWDGRAWQSLGEGVNAQVHALAVGEIGGVYVGGGFSMAGETHVNRVSYWTGTEWQALDSGVSPYDVMTISVVSDHIYVGGWFEKAGNIPVSNLALWVTSTVISVEVEKDSKPGLINIYPNPASERATISFLQEEAGTVIVEVYDLLGRKVLKLYDEASNIGLDELEWDTSRLTPGLYIVRVRSMSTERVKMISVIH
jgi:hypothetical protein